MPPGLTSGATSSRRSICPARRWHARREKNSPTSSRDSVRRPERPGGQTMAEKNRNPFKDTSFLVFAGIAVTAGALCYAKGEVFFLKGVDASISMTLDVLPRLVAAFLLAGLVEVLMPRELMRKWIGDKSGFAGLVVASVAGALPSGGAMAFLPVIAALYKL